MLWSIDVGHSRKEFVTTQCCSVQHKIKQNKTKQYDLKDGSECAHMILEQFEDLKCVGEASCAHSKIKIDRDEKRDNEYRIGCWGVGSCANATIEVKNTKHDHNNKSKPFVVAIDCFGPFSCSFLSYTYMFFLKKKKKSLEFYFLKKKKKAELKWRCKEESSCNGVELICSGRCEMQCDNARCTFERYECNPGENCILDFDSDTPKQSQFWKSQQLESKDEKKKGVNKLPKRIPTFSSSPTPRPTSRPSKLPTLKPTTKAPTPKPTTKPPTPKQNPTTR
ncbi:hypothetical protein RFI_32943, partial [Reticulomyxa filosa]